MIDYEKCLFAWGVAIILWGAFACLRATVRFFRERQRDRKFR